MGDWTIGTILARREWSEGLFSLEFEAALQPFSAGQFVRVGLELEGEQVGRPYSLVNPPSDPRHEIHFNLVSDGILSPPLAELHPGDSLLVDPRPNGFFTLDQVPKGRRLWMVATGTAIGPYISILREGKVWQQFEEVYLLHGVRLADHLSYGGVIEAATQAQPERFKFLPFVSREASDLALPGRVSDAIATGLLEERSQASLDPAIDRVMLCGNIAMIKDMSALLGEKGFSKHRKNAPGQIITEKYH
jgi:ferredoxin--NADP+ reductase